jgi:uncharacterized SAM-binding protein YcdF (DUF218 family)
MNLVATRWWSMFFMPSCVLIIGIALGVFLMLRAWRQGKRPGEARFPCWLTAASVMMLYLASTPLVARWAASTLEKDYPPVDVKTLPVADAIVVLGGSIRATRGEDGTVHVYAQGGSDRFETGLKAFEAGRAPLLAFGGGQAGVEGTPIESEWMRERAIARGVPRERTIAGPSPLYTEDESAGLSAMLRERGASHVILCSSAMHLKRASAHYRAEGLEVTPLPADFMSRGTEDHWSFMLLVPRSTALAQTDAGFKEVLGLVRQAIFKAI